MKEVSLVVIVLFLLSFVMPFGTVQAGTAVIQVDPAASTVNVGDVFKVNVTITDVTNLAVWEFQLYYLSSVLNCSQIVEGPFLKNGCNTFFTFNINNAYNATHGRLLAGSTLLGAVPGVNGSGTLATVTFKAKATGNTPLHLDDITLLDATPPPRNPIPHATNDATVKVLREPPSAYFYYYPSNPYATETVTFNASQSTPSGGAIISYEWNFGDGYLGQGIIVDHTFTSSGQYNVNLTVTDSENLANSYSKPIDIAPYGAFIDVYTQRGGKGPTEPGDAFAPEESIQIAANLIQNGTPVVGNLVTFSLYLPNGTIAWIRTSETNDNGTASSVYTLPSKPIFGSYSIKASALVSGEIISDTLQFRVGWLVEILEVVPCDRNSVPKSQFKLGELFYSRIKLQNIRFNSSIIILTLSIVDAVSQQVMFLAQEYNVSSGQATVLFSGAFIPPWASVGAATVYANAFEQIGNPAYCPEQSAPLQIEDTLPDVATVRLRTPSSEIYIGEYVQVTVVVLNDYYVAQSFNVTVKVDSTVIKTLAITNLRGYVETNLTFTWDTYDIQAGNHIMSAQASIVPDEINTTNNICVYGVHVTRISLVHDISVYHVESSKHVVGQGFLGLIDVSVLNQGFATDAFNVTVYINGTIACAPVRVILKSGDSTTITFPWNTTGLTKSKYTLSAYAAPVPDETDTLDNTCTGGIVTIAMIGDLTGPTAGVPDGKVDIRDLALAAKAYGSYLGDPRWNPDADLTGTTMGLPDNKVDIRDLAVIAKNYGKVDP